LLDYTDIGCWIVKGDPEVWDYWGKRQNDQSQPVRPGIYESGWTLGHTYRNEMVKKGDLIALWITGAVDPGIYEFGYVTEEVYDCNGFDPTYAVDEAKSQRAEFAIDYRAARLWDDYVPREEMKADPALSGAEQFRASQITNPTYLTPNETKALAALLAARVPAARMKASRWAQAL
jgi:hypothetical protein